MDRRHFLNLTAIGTATLTLPLVSCSSATEKAKEVSSTGTDLLETTVADLQAKMKEGSLSSKNITQFYLDNIEKLDKNGPALLSVIEVNPDALEIASQLDEERKNGKVRGPLHGIPVLIKDNIDTADKMMTTAGAMALAGNIASKDAFVVQQLRAAGAVLLGKTNLSEMANFRSTRSSSGWSSRGGQTRNPYIIDRSPCGSSSGSAVAVTANLCAVSVGTETNGSIACPASMNGVVGIKPTVGLVSRSGIIPISETQDTAGPFGRTVADAAALLSVIVGADPADKGRYTSKNPFPTDYTKFLDKSGLNGKRIGVDKSFLEKHEGIDALLKKALDQLRSQGAEIVEVEYMKLGDIDRAELDLLEFEFKDGLNKYLGSSNAKVKSLEEMIAFNKAHEKDVMPYFKQELLESSQAKGDLKSSQYMQVLSKVKAVADSLDKLLSEQKLDALCGPATGSAWCIDPINGDFWTGYGGYGPAAVAGFPSITVPMGNLSELPIGLSFFGKAFSEPALISMAFAYEQVSKNRFPPRYLPTVGKS